MTGPIVIAAGGTGGHFFPAEALAAALQARGARVVLLTDARSSAAKSPIFANCETHVLPGAGVAGRSKLRAILGIFAIARGALAGRGILARLAPAAVVGFGGYPSVAPVLAARLIRPRPRIILHDQNAALGKANAFLSNFADTLALSFGGTAGVEGRRTAVTGNPVRGAIAALQKAPYTPPGETINVLVLGGSLGAQAFATLIPDALARLPEALRKRIALTMQCPAPVLDAARSALAASGIQAALAPFFKDVAMLMKDAHLVIARAGGSTVAELAVIGRPAILIPLRINADQPANADALAQAGGAMRVDQTEGSEILSNAIEVLLNNPVRLQNMAFAAGNMGIVDAAGRLADLVFPAPAGNLPSVTEPPSNAAEEQSPAALFRTQKAGAFA